MKHSRLMRIISGVAGAGILFFAGCSKPAQTDKSSASVELSLARESVTRQIAQLSEDITSRLAAFAACVAEDQLFSLRLLAEDNRTAPEVTTKAGQFLKPMGFSCLTILDSSHIVLSSGEFPASAGNSMAAKAAYLTREPQLYADTIVGQHALTLQAKIPLTIADSIRFSVLGGVVVDEAFLAHLAPFSNVRVLLKTGSTITGMDGVKTLSEIKDDKILLNDKEYGAFQLDLPSVGFDDPPRLIVVVMAPGL